MGLQRTERAWGLAPASRAQDRSPVLPSTVARTGARPLSFRAVPHWRCSSRASSARRPRYCGIHARSACDRHRWAHSARSGAGDWRPPMELSIVALYYLASRRTDARFRSCHAVRHCRCSSDTSSTLPRYCGIHARSMCDLHRWGHSAWSGLGGWCSPPELGTVASYCLASRRAGARSLSFRAVPHWRCSSRASSARPRCCGIPERSSCDRHR